MREEFKRYKPRARQNGLVTERLETELLIYDRDSDRAHCLNAPAALIWENCDGANSVSQLARLLEAEIPVEARAEITRQALRQLNAAGLLQDEPALPSGSLLSRRVLIRSLGIAAAALPLVTSIIAPTPTAAATCLVGGQACTTSAECCSGLCNGAPSGTCA